MTLIINFITGLEVSVRNWGYLENWKSTASIL